jgi:hypothetical protein
MMKRIAILLLLAVYLPQAMGLRMALHFCAGDFERIVFFDDSESYCECGKHLFKSSKPNKTCCKDIHVKCELKSKQVPSSNLSLDLLTLMDRVGDVVSPIYPEIFYLNQNRETFSGVDPPPILFEKVYLLNEVFRL